MLSPFAMQSDPGEYSGERLLNYFLRATNNQAAPIVTLGRSGLVESVDCGADVRQVVRMGGDLYAVTISGIWRVSGTAAQVGTFAAGSNCRAAASDTEIAIVADGVYYVCDGTTTASYTTGSITAPVDVVFMDGYFIVAGTSAGRTDALTVSALDDGTTFDNLDFAFAEKAGDAIIGLAAEGSTLWVFGSETIQPFYNAGAADFPFLPNTGTEIERGCASRQSIANVDNSVFYVGENRLVYRSAGLAPQVISSDAVAESLDGATIECGFAFSDRGQEFYALCVAGRPTWIYAVKTQQWFEFSTGVDHDPWIAACAEWYNGQVYFGTSTGKVCTQSGYNDDGSVIRAELVSMPLIRGGEYFSINKVHMNITAGAEDIGRTPQVSLQTTRDGKTWSNEKWRPLGNQGQYLRRAAWHGLGTFRWAQGKVWITDEVNRDIVGGAYG